MRTLTTLIISGFSFFTTPTLAEALLCPPTVALPATLNLPAKPTQRQLRPVQAYLENLALTTYRYQHARSRAQRNELANCMLDHLVMLPANASLMRPATKADASTWFLIHAEAATAFNTILPQDLRFKPLAPPVAEWLTTLPSYGPDAPQTLATR